MDLSQWRDYTALDRQSLASQMAYETRNRLMPPPKYLWLHHEAKLSEADLAALKEWAVGLNSR
jgi:hypothetical protein